MNRKLRMLIFSTFWYNIVQFKLFLFYFPVPWDGNDLWECVKETLVVKQPHASEDIPRRMLDDLAQSLNLSPIKEEISDLATLSSYLMKHGITHTDITPTLLKHLEETPNTVSKTWCTYCLDLTLFWNTIFQMHLNKSSAPNTVSKIQCTDYVYLMLF